MSQNILFLAHLDESGQALPRAVFEVLGAALELFAKVNGVITIGLIGEHIQAAADTLASTGARILGVSGPDYSQARYATDSAAAEAICCAVSPEIVIAPSTSRFQRVMAGVAHRLGGQIDTHHYVVRCRQFGAFGKTLVLPATLASRNPA